MGRRQNREVAINVAKLMGLVIGASILVPRFRPLVLGLGLLVIAVVAVVGVVALGVFLIRRVAPKSLLNSPHSTHLYSATLTPVTTLKIRPQTTADLIEQLRAIDWFQFEKLVALTYRKLGYTVIRRGGANPDGGIDLVIEKDNQRAAIQCKQWRTWNVGIKAVREFLGALTDAGIQNGIFITLCGYTGDAKQLAEKHRIEIVNEIGLAQILESTDARFDLETIAILNNKSKSCPKCENEMVLRTATRGLGVGKQFWGCSSYPRCRFTMPTE